MDSESEKSSTETADPNRDPETAEYVAHVKEKAALKDEISVLTKKLNNTKGQNYDLLIKIEKLEKENGELKKQGSTQGKRGKKKKPAKRKVPRKKHPSDSDAASQNDEIFESQEALYAAIAEKFPELPLSTVLFAEKKFIEADVNNDGTVDAEELEKILDTTKLLFTKNDVMQILEQIDTDGTNSLDFMECLQVCDTLRTNRKTGLPQSIQQNKSTLCTVQ